jgi:hypothetical protein
VKKIWILVAVLAAGCTETTPQWQLEHDRVIAVRATPPHIPAGERSDLDVLITTLGGDGPEVVAPMFAQGAPGFESAVIHAETGWAVIAPDEATLAAAREAMGLEPGAPVPLTVGLAVTAGETDLAAIKTVYLGDEGDNPELGDVTIDGEPARDDMVVPTGEEIELTIDADDELEKVDWLSSVGDLTDFNDALGHLEAPEAMDGFVAVVKRDLVGGVVWGYWAVAAE